MTAEQTEKVRYWKSGDDVGIETTTVWTDPDGGRTTAVAGSPPDDARVISESEYRRVVANQDADRAIAESNARTALLKRVTDKKSAIDKLTQLGLTEAQAQALTS